MTERIIAKIINLLSSLDLITDPQVDEFEIQDGSSVFFVNYDAENREIRISEYDNFGDLMREIDGDEFLKHMPCPKEYLHEIDFCNLLLTHKI